MEAQLANVQHEMTWEEFLSGAEARAWLEAVIERTVLGPSTRGTLQPLPRDDRLAPHHRKEPPKRRRAVAITEITCVK